MRDEGAWLVGELTFELTHRHVFTYIHVQALKIQQYVGELSSVSQWYFSQPAQTSKKKSHGLFLGGHKPGAHNQSYPSLI